MSVWSKTRESDEVEVMKPLHKGREGDAPVGVSTKLTPESVLEDSLIERYGKPRSVISQGSSLTGTLHFDSSVRVDGKLSGDISCKGIFIVGPRGCVDAKVEAMAIVVLGRIQGEIHGREKVELLHTARVEGTLHTPLLEAEPGCHISGKVRLSSSPSQLLLDGHSAELMAPAA